MFSKDNIEWIFFSPENDFIPLLRFNMLEANIVFIYLFFFFYRRKKLKVTITISVLIVQRVFVSHPIWHVIFEFTLENALMSVQDVIKRLMLNQQPIAI